MFFYIGDFNTDEITPSINDLSTKLNGCIFEIIKLETESNRHAFYYTWIFEAGYKPYTGQGDVDNLRNSSKTIIGSVNSMQAGLFVVLLPIFEPDIEIPPTSLANDFVVLREVPANYIDGFHLTAFLAGNVTNMVAVKVYDLLCAHG